MAAREEFEKLGVRLVAVVDQDIGINEFMQVAWHGGELYVDSEAKFKAAMGAPQANNWALLHPRVLLRIFSLAKRWGNSQADLQNPTSARMGGELVIGPGDRGVVAEFHETKTFGHATLDQLLAAAKEAAGSGSEL
eukprot:g5536.t1